MVCLDPPVVSPRWARRGVARRCPRPWRSASVSAVGLGWPVGGLGRGGAARPGRLGSAWPRLRLGRGGSARSARPARRPRLRLGRVDHAASLVDQRRQPVGEASRQCLKQTGELPHRGSDRAGELGEQHLTRRKVREGARTSGIEQLGTEEAALHDELRVHAAEVPEHLRDRPDVVANEDDRRRALQVLVESCLVAVRGRTAHQGVLEDLVVRTRGAQLAAQGCQVAHLEAAVLGEDGRARSCRDARAPPQRRRPSQVSVLP